MHRPAYGLGAAPLHRTPASVRRPEAWRPGVTAGHRQRLPLRQCPGERRAGLALVRPRGRHAASDGPLRPRIGARRAKRPERSRERTVTACGTFLGHKLLPLPCLPS